MKMKRLLLAVFCLVASPALAQTTFVSGDCNANITRSGGDLTLTSTNVGSPVGCRASVGKQSGLLYYTATVNAAPVSTVWGVAGGGAGTILPAPTTYWATSAGYGTGNNYQAAVLRSDGSQFWNNATVSGGAAVTSGKTVAIAFNLNTDPRQMWVTSDVTSLVCNGSGGSGSTAPKWNGSCASDPTLPGTGNPIGVFPSGATAGTGAKFYIPGGMAYPIWQGQNTDSSTFNFSATVPAYLVSVGYVNWNNSSGNHSYPGPLDPMQIITSNAPGWTSGTYASGAKINAGAGWNGTAYTNALPVCVFGLVTPGTSGSDPTVFDTPCASGTPSNTGGIPGGSWPGATTVTDGGVTWALLDRVDYVTITGAVVDAPAWTPSTQYPGYTYVQNGGIAYAQFNPFGSVATCTSGSGSGPPSSDGTCSWQPVGRIIYSSGANQWPHMKYFGTDSMQYNYNVKITMFYGGTAQQVYGPQQPGESLSGGANSIIMAFHQDLPGDQDFYCLGGYGIADRNNGCSAWSWLITPAPGDSIVNNLTSSDPLRIDQTKGVTITNTSTTTTSGGWNGTAGEPIVISDNNGIINGMQLLSVHGTTAPWHGGGGNGGFPGNGHGNQVAIVNSILQSGPGGNGVFITDGGSALLNSLIIDGSTVAGTEGVEFGYGQTIMANNIVVGTGASNSTCVMNQANFAGTQHKTFYNNLCLGFTFPNGTTTGQTWTSPLAASNATDSPASGYGGTYTSATGIGATSEQMPGVNTSSGCGTGLSSPCSGLTAATELVNPTIGGSFDARLKSGAFSFGAGANYSTLQGALPDGSSSAAVLDILGSAWSPRWDIAAEKFNGAPPAYTLVSVNLSGNTFTFGCAPSTVIGHVTVTATGGTFSSALTRTGANTGGFALSSSSIPSDLISNPSTGCPASGGPFSDLNIVATDGTAVGSPLTQPETLTGSGGPPPATALRLCFRMGRC